MRPSEGKPEHVAQLVGREVERAPLTIEATAAVCPSKQSRQAKSIALPKLPDVPNEHLVHDLLHADHNHNQNAKLSSIWFDSWCCGAVKASGTSRTNPRTRGSPRCARANNEVSHKQCYQRRWRLSHSSRTRLANAQRTTRPQGTGA